ncbi:MAG: flagellin [Myxococcota bacterium]
MISIHSNTSALKVQGNLAKTSSSFASSLEKLSSGFRINSAADDAAGLAVGKQMNSDVKAMTQAQRNTNDAVSVIQTAEGAMAQQTDILTRMKELSVQANSGALSTAQLGNIDQEFQALILEFDDIATSTEFNGNALLDGSANMDIQVGKDAADTVNITINDMQAAGVGAGGTDLTALDVTTSANAAAAQADIETALNDVLAERATLGGLQNRMEAKIEAIGDRVTNTSASLGRIMDLDVAKEMASFTKSQVLQQAGSAMLAQANSRPQAALALF